MMFNLSSVTWPTRFALNQEVPTTQDGPSSYSLEITVKTAAAYSMPPMMPMMPKESTVFFIPKNVVPKKVRSFPQLTLEPPLQENEQWDLDHPLKPHENEDRTLQQYPKAEIPAAIPRAGAEIPPHCNIGVRCIPRIVMLPVFSLPNGLKQNGRKKDPRKYRR